MKFTLDQYINNPMGEKNSVVTQKGMYRQMYSEKLDKIILREGGRIKYTLYTIKENERYLIHLKIPSEVIDLFYYDVIIEFYTTEKQIMMSTSLKDYYVKFYSNDPSFVFTFAHAFIKNKIFCEDFESKMSKDALKKVAKEKNPKNIVGYVKSLFFAYLVIQNYGLYSKKIFETSSKPYKLKDILNNVMHADMKIASRQDADRELQKKVRLKKAIRKERNVSRLSGDGIVKTTSMVSMTSRTNGIGNVGGIKKSKVSKKI